MGKLVIVESPAKAKTIQKHLGKGFEVLASNGHIRDLPKSKLGVDVENNFEPQYTEIKGKESVVKALKKEAKKSEMVYLATDPDREGEAISWHLAHMLGLDLEATNRVTFNEITKTGIDDGMSHPRQIDQDLVNAQQARRILDRIVGYKLSPFLWRKVRKGLSAGRVQSVAVKLIVDREKEIRDFITEEYWSITAMLSHKRSKAFEAKLHSLDGKKIAIANEEQAKEILGHIDGKDFIVDEVKKSVRRRSPAPPFTTSTLQQEASKKLGFQARRTMKAAQELYEGVEIPELGAVGLITYMRTDSLRISAEALEETIQFIQESYGKEYLPSKPREFKSKKSAQDAHEAIRPTMPSLTPDKVKKSLTSDQFKLYKLIWERFVACQMAVALLDAVSVRIAVGDYIFTTSGYTVKFDGFTKLYEEKEEDESKQEDGPRTLPEMAKGDKLNMKKVEPNQHFTQPPPRFTEASLIKTLEENGIGRPSTYAPTITTILARNYVERDAKALKPTALGEVTTELMEEQFKNIVDQDFTANMENQLDEIEEGKTDWKQILDSFYTNFAKTLEEAEVNMEGKRVKVPDEETDVDCELCGKKMVIKIGRFGKFLACPGFPDCRNTKKIAVETGGICPVCGKKVLEKKSKNNRKYYGCEGFPDCTFMTWDKPLAEKCPQCDSALFRKTGRGAETHCLKEGCGYVKEEE